jgi:ribose 5-phosphate isomerase B
MRICLGSDHAGFELKEQVKTFLGRIAVEVNDIGTHSAASVDYPDFAAKVATEVQSGAFERGILVCGSGVGMCITANKFSGIRAVLAWNPEIARLSREHNDTNILCLPGRFMDAASAEQVITIWLQTPFQGGRHQQRVDKISALEEH